MRAVAAFFASIIFIGSLSAPLSSSALTEQEKTSLILQIVQKVLELQQQIVALGGAPITIPPGLATAAQGNTNSAEAAASSCTVERTLALGMKGDDVKCLQTYLIAQNLLAPDSATGYFGPLTRAAVVALQKAHGLEQVGIVGRLTRALIAERLSAQAESAPSTSSIPSAGNVSTAAPSGSGGSTLPPGGDGNPLPFPTPPPVTPPTAPPPSAPDTTPPVVSITAPAASSTVSGIVTVAATASDNVGVAGVQFKLDGANLGVEDATAPYSIFWNTASTTSGARTVTAVARDAAENTEAASVSVTVANARHSLLLQLLFCKASVLCPSFSTTGRSNRP